MDRVVVVSIIITKIDSIDWCHLEPVVIIYRAGSVQQETQVEWDQTSEKLI